MNRDIFLMCADKNAEQTSDSTFGAKVGWHWPSLLGDMCIAQQAITTTYAECDTNCGRKYIILRLHRRQCASINMADCPGTPTKVQPRFVLTVHDPGFSDSDIKCVLRSDRNEGCLVCVVGTVDSKYVTPSPCQHVFDLFNSCGVIPMDDDMQQSGQVSITTAVLTTAGPPCINTRGFGVSLVGVKTMPQHAEQTRAAQIVVLDKREIGDHHGSTTVMLPLLIPITATDEEVDYFVRLLRQGMPIAVLRNYLLPKCCLTGAARKLSFD
jgi:hypothetical protein